MSDIYIKINLMNYNINMLFCFFKKVFLGFKQSFYIQDKPRLDSQVYPEEVKISSFAYGNDNYQQFNLYKIDDKVKPLIIDIHGGAWVYGDKDLNNLFCCHLCQRGFDVISIGYRLAGDVLISGMVEDIFAALNYIKENKDKLNINLDNIFLTGDSAGGHLSLITAVLLKNKDLTKKLDLIDVDLNIKGLCLNHAVPFTNIAGRIDGHKILSKYVGNPGLKRILYGKHYKKDKWYKLLVSPTLYINKDSDLPNLLILTSEADVRYFYQSQMLHDLLVKRSIKHFYIDEKDYEGTHVYNVIYPESILGTKTNDDMSNFFKNIIKF